MSSSNISIAVAAVGAFFQNLTDFKWVRSDLINECAREKASQTSEAHKRTIKRMLAEYDDKKNA